MYISAFLLGFLGSFHCLGMCGPIALTLGGGQSFGIRLIFEKVAYNFGRAITYSVLGATAGLIGQGLVWVVGYQMYISILLGVVIMSIGIFAVNPDNLLAKVPAIGNWFKTLRNLFLKFLSKGGVHTFFTLGLLNGLLPCGLVYVGLVGALSTGTLLKGMTYMFVFGFGTMPMMLLAAVMGKFINVKFRNTIKKTYPLLFIVMGVFLIFRGINTNVHAHGDTIDHSVVPQVVCH